MVGLRTLHYRRDSTHASYTCTVLGDRSQQACPLADKIISWSSTRKDAPPAFPNPDTLLHTSIVVNVESPAASRAEAPDIVPPLHRLPKTVQYDQASNGTQDRNQHRKESDSRAVASKSSSPELPSLRPVGTDVCVADWVEERRSWHTDRRLDVSTNIMAI